MKTPDERFAWARDYCRRLPLRHTLVRERILAFLASQRLPVTFSAVVESEAVRGRCDPATVYRSLMLFADAQVVRLFHFRGKVSYFVLNLPDEFFHYFICNRCGELMEFASGGPAPALAEALAHGEGCPHESHGLIVFGICGRCHAEAQHLGPTLKVTPRLNARPIRAGWLPTPSPFLRPVRSHAK